MTSGPGNGGICGFLTIVGKGFPIDPFQGSVAKPAISVGQKAALMDVLGEGSDDRYCREVKGDSQILAVGHLPVGSACVTADAVLDELRISDIPRLGHSDVCGRIRWPIGGNYE